jgi:hypothetical protein
MVYVQYSKHYNPVTLVIHGGAGTIKRDNMTSEKENLYSGFKKQGEKVQVFIYTH